jgi:hypothetical protein
MAGLPLDELPLKTSVYHWTSRKSVHRRNRYLHECSTPFVKRNKPEQFLWSPLALEWASFASSKITWGSRPRLPFLFVVITRLQSARDLQFQNGAAERLPLLLPHRLLDRLFR